MRTTTVKLAAAALLALLPGGAVTADPPADPNKPAEQKKPSQLEELIAQALRDNPDIRVAEAKTREAEAELNRARLQVIQKVVAHQHTVETLQGGVKVAEASVAAAQAKLTFAEAEFARMTELKKQNAIDARVVDEKRANVEQARANLENAKAALQSAKADLAKAQAELPYLLGKANKDDKQSDATRRALEWLKNHGADNRSAAEQALYALSIMQAEAAWKAADLPRGTVADKLRPALDKKVNLKIATDTPLGEVLDYLQKMAGVPIVTTLQRDEKVLGMDLQDVPLGAAFQCVEDVGKVQFGVRDYGILVSDKLPTGVKRLHDFWKEPARSKADEGKKP
jgi:outer membrane protein TolC